MTFVVVYLVIVTLYLITNHHALDSARTLPLTFIDIFVPFLPWTGWIYSTVYLMPFVMVQQTTDREHFRIFVGSFIVAAIIVISTFIFYPTVYPRPLIGEIGVSSLALYLIQIVDSPANCFPSGHVTFGFLSAFCWGYTQPKYRNAALIWALIVSVSTLTTKQHYVWDIIVGYGLARVIYKFSEILFLKRGEVYE